MHKPKVIRIIARLNIGGPAMHTILLSNGLNQGAFRDTLVCGTSSASEGDMSYLGKDKYARPLIIPELGREISLKKDFTAFLRLYSLMRRERPDIVHTHTAKAGALGRLAAALAGVPIKVHTFHGHIFDGYFSPIKAKTFIFLERILALFTDRLITVSERIKYDIVNRLKVTQDRKCAVIPLGLELDKFLDCERERGAFRKTLAIDDAAQLVGIVGRLVPIKNHRMFLNAARRLKSDLPGLKVKFIIVGDGELRGELEDYSHRLGLREDVIFTGWVKDLACVYADLDVVALTSLNEGTPVSLIEAMASGRPVIATEVGGIRDLISPDVNGILARSGDVDDFCSGLISLLNDSDKRRELGKRGRDSVAVKYSKDRLIKDVEALYQNLISERENRQ